MKLAIYKKDGKINNVHAMDDNKKDYSKGVLDYNARNADKGASVEVHEFSDDSLVAYLFERKDDYRKEFQEELREIVRKTDCLYSKLDWLEGELKKMDEEDTK